MNVFVCYTWEMYDGAGNPERVFSREEDAREWCIQQEKLHNNGSYVALHVEDSLDD